MEKMQLGWIATWCWQRLKILSKDEHRKQVLYDLSKLVCFCCGKIKEIPDLDTFVCEVCHPNAEDNEDVYDWQR